MSLYIGEDDSGNNIVHLTKEEKPKTGLTDGSTYIDSIIGPNIAYAYSDIIDLGVHYAKVVSYDHPYSHVKYTGSGYFFGPFYFADVPGLDNSFYSVAKALVLVTDTVTNATLLMSRSILVNSLSDSYFYINDILVTYYTANSSTSNPKRVMLVLYGAADIPYSGEVRISADEFTVGGVDVTTFRTAIMEINSKTKVDEMLSNNSYGDSFTVSYPHFGECNFTVGHNLGFENASSINSTKLELTQNKVVFKDGNDILFNSDFGYTKAYEHSDETLIFRSDGPGPYDYDIAAKIYNPSFLLNDVGPTTTAILFHKLTFGINWWKGTYTLGEEVYNVLVPACNGYVFVPTNAGDFFPYYNRTIVYYKIDTSTKKVTFATSSIAEYDQYSWGSAVGSNADLNIKIEGYTVFN